MHKKCIDVVVFGAPNSGKSTLANSIVNSEVCIVSSKPHTTRIPTLAIYTQENIQVVFIDTPGISNKIRKDETNLTALAKKNLENADLCLFIFDGARRPPIHLIDFAHFIDKPKIAFINKIDKEFSKGKLLPFTDNIKTTFNHIFYGSAVKKIGTQDLLNFITQFANDGEWKFENTQKTTRPIEELINDRTQEVIFETMSDEIPYHTKVKITSLDEKKSGDIIIHQDILIKPAYKHIFLGHIKTLSMKSRKKIEKMLNTKVHLYLNVKFDKNL